ncbi:hypothetical protein NQ314_004433, partial [Rhamnusium bicolor]
RIVSPGYDVPDNVSDIDDLHLAEEVTVKIENEQDFCSSKSLKTENKVGLSKKTPHKSKKDDNNTKGKNFQCANCGKGFYTKGELVVHIRLHSESRPFSCQECNMRFKFRQSLQRHRLIHSSIRSYMCDVCGKGETPFICPICNKGYRSSTSLKKHREVTHYEIEDIKENTENKDGHEKTEENSKNMDKRECKI